MNLIPCYIATHEYDTDSYRKDNRIYINADRIMYIEEFDGIDDQKIERTFVEIIMSGQSVVIWEDINTLLATIQALTPQSSVHSQLLTEFTQSGRKMAD